MALTPGGQAAKQTLIDRGAKIGRYVNDGYFNDLAVAQSMVDAMRAAGMGFAVMGNAGGPGMGTPAVDMTMAGRADWLQLQPANDSDTGGWVLSWYPDQNAGVDLPMAWGMPGYVVSAGGRAMVAWATPMVDFWRAAYGAVGGFDYAGGFDV